jgi:hypothetical protein
LGEEQELIFYEISVGSAILVWINVIFIYFTAVLVFKIKKVDQFQLIRKIDEKSWQNLPRIQRTPRRHHHPDNMTHTTNTVTISTTTDSKDSTSIETIDPSRSTMSSTASPRGDIENEGDPGGKQSDLSSSSSSSSACSETENSSRSQSPLRRRTRPANIVIVDDAIAVNEYSNPNEPMKTCSNKNEDSI